MNVTSQRHAQCKYPNIPKIRQRHVVKLAHEDRQGLVKPNRFYGKCSGFRTSTNGKSVVKTGNNGLIVTSD